MMHLSLHQLVLKSNARISKQSRFHHGTTIQSRFIIHEGVMTTALLHCTP